MRAGEFSTVRKNSCYRFVTLGYSTNVSKFVFRKQHKTARKTSRKRKLFCFAKPLGLKKHRDFTQYNYWYAQEKETARGSLFSRNEV